MTKICLEAISPDSLRTCERCGTSCVSCNSLFGNVHQPVTRPVPQQSVYDVGPCPKSTDLLPCMPVGAQNNCPRCMNMTSNKQNTVLRNVTTKTHWLMSFVSSAGHESITDEYSVIRESPDCQQELLLDQRAFLCQIIGLYIVPLITFFRLKLCVLSSVTNTSVILWHPK
jgi:hypothetical protein